MKMNKILIGLIKFVIFFILLLFIDNEYVNILLARVDVGLPGGGYLTIIKKMG